MVGQVGQQLLDDVGPRLAVGHDADHDARVAFEVGGAAELLLADVDAGELAHHDRAAHERVGVAGHDDEVHQPEQQRRAGDGGPVDDRERGHDARALA